MRAQLTRTEHSPSSTGFTLIEVLTVLVILSLMAGMVVAAVRGVTTTARAARTRSIIASIDSVIQEQYASYRYRALAVEVPDTHRPTSPVSTVDIGFDVLAVEAARVRLMMIRDLQRMELPDRLADLSDAPVVIRAASSPAAINSSTGAIENTRDDKAQRRMLPVTWYAGGDDVPSKIAAYKVRLQGTTPSTDNQAAECLYLIMATSFVGGSPAIEAIPTANIDDTDDDGLPEILDGWGQPLGFIRWPVGYLDPEALVDTSIPDEFDLFRSDYAYFVDSSVSTLGIPRDVTSGTPTNTMPWSVRPIVFSAGPDGEFGIALNPWSNTNTEEVSFSYVNSSWDWPVSAAYYGSEQPGRGVGLGSTTYSNHSFIDPYLRRFVATHGGSASFAGLLPGQPLTSSLANEERADNITNYALQATQ